MKLRKIRWFLIACAVSTTLLMVSLKPSDGVLVSAISPVPVATPLQRQGPFVNMNKYAIADFNGVAPTDSIAAERRKQINQRYDSQDLVFQNPSPDDSAVGVHDELPLVRAVPAVESTLVVVGKVTKLEGFLSNDRRGVYTEITIHLDKELRKGSVIDVEKNGMILSADRAGGYVRYPNGQKVLYFFHNRGLPEQGKEYLFFLKADKNSPNFQIVTLYELTNDEIIPLDLVDGLDPFKSMDKSGFLNAVAEKVVEGSL